MAPTTLSVYDEAVGVYMLWEHAIIKWRMISTSTLQELFVDLRVTLVVMILWLSCVLTVFISLNMDAPSPFFRLGPSSNLMFFHTSIDTPQRYEALVCLIVIHTMISDVIADSLVPHIMNIVQNRQLVYIPHSKFIYYLISSTWSVYTSLSSLFCVYIAFCQIDLVLVRLAADILANLITTRLYLEGKKHDVVLYKNSIAEAVELTLFTKEVDNHTPASCADSFTEYEAKVAPSPVAAPVDKALLLHLLDV